jgi:hypothetical protein
VGLVTTMERWPVNESLQVAVVGNIWGFGDKMDGTVIDCVQFNHSGLRYEVCQFENVGGFIYTAVKML